MAKREVLAIYRDTPSGGTSTGKAALAGDTYLLPRDVFTTTGVCTSDVANSGTNIAHKLDTSVAFTGTTKLFSVQNNGTERMALDDAGGFSLPRCTITDDGTASFIKTTGTMNLQVGAATVLQMFNLFGIDLWFSKGQAGVSFTSARTATSANPAFQFTTSNTLTSGGNLANFNQGTSIKAHITRDGAFGATEGLGLWGTTAAKATQHTTTGNTTGFVAGAGTAARADSEWDGDSGTKGYTVGDIVSALKDCGILDLT